MATLREVQLALQEKIEHLKQRDELIDELEDELLSKDKTIEHLRRQVVKYKSLVKRLSTNAQQQQVPVARQPKPTVQWQQQPTSPQQLQIPPRSPPIAHHHRHHHHHHHQQAKVSNEEMNNFQNLTESPITVIISSSSPARNRDMDTVRPKLMQIRSFNDAKEDNNNFSPALPADKRRMLFIQDKTKVFTGSESCVGRKF